MTDNTSGGGGETPNPSTTATVTPAQSGAMPATTPPALTVEELLKRNADLEHSQNNAKEELERHRKKLSAYEKQEQERAALEQAAKDAQLSEIERVKKQHADAEARIKQQQQQLVMAQIKLVAKDKGILNSELIAPFVERKLEYDKDGEPTNLEAVLDEIIKGNPNLVAKPAEPATPPAQTAPTPQAPAVPAMNPGRSNISAPGNVPGRRYNLTDRDIWTAPGTPSKWQP